MAGGCGQPVLAKNENVAADLSGLLEGQPDLEEIFRDSAGYIAQLQTWLQYAGAYDRILYGTDWPIIHIKTYLAFIRRLIPEKYHEAVFFENANRILPLGALREICFAFCGKTAYTYSHKAMEDREGMKLGFIGAGNMATAIFSGALKQNVLESQDVALYDVDTKKSEEHRKAYGITVCDSAQALVDCAILSFWAVKPIVAKAS